MGVLHARNDDGQIVNRVHWFNLNPLSLSNPLSLQKPTVQYLGRTGELVSPREIKRDIRVAGFRYPRRIGFQYKCFVDYEGKWTAKDVEDELRKWGVENPDEGLGRPDRIWFLIPGYPEASRNNCVYPE